MYTYAYVPGGFPVQELHQLVSPSKPCHPECEQPPDQSDSVVCVNTSLDTEIDNMGATQPRSQAYPISIFCLCSQ